MVEWGSELDTGRPVVEVRIGPEAASKVKVDVGYKRVHMGNG